MNIFQRVWDSFGFNEQFDEGDYDYEYGDEDYVQDPTIQEQPMLPRGEQRVAAPPVNNVIGMPNRANGISEVVILQPRSFEEIPHAVKLLRERKSVILNMMLMDPDQAQRSVDFVAGGVFAIDGHQERLGENIFLFTPNVVQITANGSAQTTAFTPPVVPVPAQVHPSMSVISPAIATQEGYRQPPDSQFRLS
ncbi:MAG: cell division protein SepF [Leptolyngbyaceae cyanobacterium bins.349]|nr:cell division protein SepF [Leptolyngbyaceae cyanobacterium bins.349]